MEVLKCDRLATQFVRTNSGQIRQRNPVCSQTYAKTVVTSDGKAMCTSVKIFPDIFRSKLAITENLVGFGLSLIGYLWYRSCSREGLGSHAVFLDGTVCNEFDK